MDMLAQLESYSDELATAVKSLAAYCRHLDVDRQEHQALVDPDAPTEVHRARASILSNVAKVRTLLNGPTDLLQHLASQNAMLACLRWLGEFQILACIPLVGSVSLNDVAALSGVSPDHLARIIRLTATVAFLLLHHAEKEGQPDHVSHTPLSASFVVNPALLDAVMFLGESAAPASLQMVSATQRWRLAAPGSHQADSAWNLALDTTTPFHTLCRQRPKLGRQLSAYRHYAAGLPQLDEVVDLLSLAQLSWSNLSKACIIEMGAQSTSIAHSLADRYPSLRLVVQISHASPAPAYLDMDCLAPLSNRGWGGTDERTDRVASRSARITVTNRPAGARQPVTDAALYILHLPPASSSGPAAIRAQLQDHLGVLRANGAVMLVLTAGLLPEPGSLSDPAVEAVALARDLGMLQLANEGEMAMVELLDMIQTVRDSVGKLVVTNRLRAPDGLVVAVAVQHQAYADAFANF